jgi:hypothetical protein
MRINSAKILSVFSTTLTLIVLLPGITTAQLSIPGSPDGTTTAPNSTAAPTNSAPSQLNDLTPEQRTAIRQTLLRERNQQIIEILDDNQKDKFYEGLRKRRKLSTTLEDLNLTPDQQSRLNTVLSEYNNKLQMLTTGKPSKSPQQTTPTTTTP